MGGGPQVAILSGGRLHLQHGPIDLIVKAWGEERDACYRQAARRFETVLAGLVDELPALRRPAGAADAVSDPVALRMVGAAKPFGDVFVTPMAAVAGAVADEVLGAAVAGRACPKAFANNGGDVAFHLSGGEETAFAGPTGRLRVRSGDPVRGVATSGWCGRSHSFGVADAVTVAASSAAVADVAATLIANAVDLPGHPAITRAPANALSPDSDLGERLVTTDVGRLSPDEVAEALAAGRAVAKKFVRRGLIRQAALLLAGETVVVADRNMVPEGVLDHA